MKARFKISSFLNPSGVKVFRVHGYKSDGTRVRENFKTEDEAKGRQAELFNEELNLPDPEIRMRKTRLSDSQLLDAEAAFKKLGEKSILDAVDFFIRNYREPQTEIDLKEAFEVFLREKESARRRVDTVQSLRVKVGRFVRNHPGKRVSDISRDDLERFLNRPLSPVTINNERRALSSFFNWAKGKKYCAESPLANIDPLKEDEKRPVILPLDKVRTMLSFAQDFKGGIMIPYFSLALFAGLRPKELERLKWEAIDFKAKLIRIDGETAKKRSFRNVDMSRNLIEWLKPFIGTPIVGKNWRRDFDRVKREAGYGRKSAKFPGLSRWVPDILRHTAVSNHFTRTKHEGETAIWAGNSPDMIHKHYRGLVTPKEAKAFWALNPSPVPRKVIQLPRAA